MKEVSALEYSLRGFESDNCSPVHPDVMQALYNINKGHISAYGDDPYSKNVLKKIEALFGGDCNAHFVLNGTGANVVCLNALCPTWGGVICCEQAHIAVDEAGAPEHLIGGKLLTVPCEGNKLTPDLASKYLRYISSQHQSQPKIISITQPTEFGTLYNINEIVELSRFAHEHGMYLHMDSSRMANALVSLGCTAKAMTCDAGVDALSFGASKNGTMFGEAVVFFIPLDHIPNVRKSCTQLLSKMRYIAAQFDAYLSNDLWLRCAENANQMALLLEQNLKKYVEIKIPYPVQANEIFAYLPQVVRKQLHKRQRFLTRDENNSLVRFVCSFDTSENDVFAMARELDELIKLYRGNQSNN